MKIQLRKTTLDDIEFVLQSEQDDKNKEFIGQWNRDQHINSLQNKDINHLIIENSVSGMRIGYIILAGLTNPNNSIEFIRIVINDKGKGYGRDSVRLIKKLVFEDLKAHRLWLDVKESNTRAQSLYKSQGFILEAKLRDCIKADDHYESLIIMSILESEYMNI